MRQSGNFKWFRTARISELECQDWREITLKNYAKAFLAHRSNVGNIFILGK